MTERWRKRLGDLDKQSPSEDLFERAKGGPQLPDEPISRPTASARIVTGIAAFVVFALAISVFAIPALRLKGDSSGPAGLDVQLPLWPERTLDGLRQLQTDADDGKASWALDPGQVATRFGQTVAGLQPVYAHDEGLVPGSNYYPSFSGSSGVMLPASYEPLAPTSTSTSPYRTYSLNQCAPDNEISSTICDYDSIGPPSVKLVLYQPLGSGVWAVLEAHSSYVTLPDQPGETIGNGSTLSAGFRLPSNYHVKLGFHIGQGSCDVSGSTTNSHSPGQIGPNGFISAGSALAVILDVSSAAGCSEQEPGYVYAAVADTAIGGDGLSGTLLGPGDHRLLAFAAVPITASLPRPDESSSASISPTEGPIKWTSHSDSLGWTIDVPESWVVHPIDGSDSRVSYQGSAFGSAPLEHAPGGPTTVFPPTGEVMLMITHREGGPLEPPADDSAFPLSYEDLAPAEGGLSGTFDASGTGFDLVIRFADVTAEQEAILQRMVASISFEAWHVGDSRHGWTAVGKVLLASSAEWLTYQGDHYVATNDGTMRQLLGPAPTCAGGGGSHEVRETGVAGISCSDGTGGDWDFTTGDPQPGNIAGFDVPLASYPAVRTGSGMLLVQFPQTQS